jgi:hypothetical protein
MIEPSIIIPASLNYAIKTDCPQAQVKNLPPKIKDYKALETKFAKLGNYKRWG